jgi:hypothetical protein
VALNRLSPAPKIPFPAAGSESDKRRVIEHRLRNGIGLRLLLLDVFADGRLDDPSISDGGDARDGSELGYPGLSMQGRL